MMVLKEKEKEHAIYIFILSYAVNYTK